jgi:FAD/FMN-containing dehydrogenase
VGGATPDGSGRAVVLSLQRMNRVRAIDPVGNTVTAEAGVVLANLQDAARAAQRLFPLSLASEGSCTLGGNLSTNAGGTGVLRYGNTRELCLALEAVTAHGEIIGSRNGVLHGLRKDNTGYDLRDLFIGAEGTLGIITAAVMKLFPLPRARVTGFAAVRTPRQALALLELAHATCGSTLTAFELVCDLALQLVEKHFPGNRYPLQRRTPFGVLLELSDHEDEAHATQLFEGLLERALEAGLVEDAVVAQSIDQSKALWALREFISEAQAAEGQNIKHDISLPIAHLADFIESTDAALQVSFPGVRMVNFGHMGDGNLHYNVSPRVGETEQEFLAQGAAINRLVYDAVDAYGGSISAEHGLGQLKREDIRRYKSPNDLALMRVVKQALDPRGIMNPHKVL